MCLFALSVSPATFSKVLRETNHALHFEEGVPNASARRLFLDPPLFHLEYLSPLCLGRHFGKRVTTAQFDSELLCGSVVTTMLLLLVECNFDSPRHLLLVACTLS